MAIELIIKEPTHSFHRMKVEGHPGLERVMTPSSDCLVLPKAVEFARHTYDGVPFVLQSPEDAWIARLAQDHENPTHIEAFDYQMTRGIALVWFEKEKQVITIHTGIPHNLALNRAQEGYESFKTTDDWQVPLAECREIIALQNDRIRPYPGEYVKRSTKNEAERDQLTQDLFGEATPLVAKQLSDMGYDMLDEHFPSTAGIKPKHARIRVVGLGVVYKKPYNLNADWQFHTVGRARGVSGIHETMKLEGT